MERDNREMDVPMSETCQIVCPSIPRFSFLLLLLRLFLSFFISLFLAPSGASLDQVRRKERITL